MERLDQAEIEWGADAGGDGEEAAHGLVFPANVIDGLV